MPIYHTSEITISIQLRFFEAIDAINKKGILGDHRGGLATFCKIYGFNVPTYQFVRKFTRCPEGEAGGKLISIDAIYYLVKDYNVSAEWLFLGKGAMFKK